MLSICRLVKELKRSLTFQGVSKECSLSPWLPEQMSVLGRYVADGLS